MGSNRRTMSDRAIKLKEHAANHDYLTTPDEHYRSARGGRPEGSDFRVRTDEHGLIVSGRSASGRKIIGLGDSVMECIHVHEQNRVCARIEQGLGIDAQVLNGGYSGATVLHHVTAMLNKIIPMWPAGVFVMTGIMDIEAMGKPSSFWANDVYTRSIFVPGDSATWVPDTAPSLDTGNRKRLINSLIDVCRNFGIPVCFISTPHLQVYEGYYVQNTFSPDEFAHRTLKRKLANATAADVCEASSVPFYDIEAEFADRPDLFHDDIHMNDEGAALFASTLEGMGFYRLLRQWVG